MAMTLAALAQGERLNGMLNRYLTNLLRWFLWNIRCSKRQFASPSATTMFQTTEKPFIQSHLAYRFEYSAHWDQVVEKDGESFGFGPLERDDIGLWIKKDRRVRSRRRHCW